MLPAPGSLLSRADSYLAAYGVPMPPDLEDTSWLAGLPTPLKSEDFTEQADYTQPLPPPTHRLTRAQRIMYRLMAGNDSHLQAKFFHYINDPSEPPEPFEMISDLPRIWPPKHLAHLKNEKLILRAYLEGLNYYFCFCYNYVFRDRYVIKDIFKDTF